MLLCWEGNNRAQLIEVEIRKETAGFHEISDMSPVSKGCRFQPIIDRLSFLVILRVKTFESQSFGTFEKSSTLFLFRKKGCNLEKPKIILQLRIMICAAQTLLIILGEEVISKILVSIEINFFSRTENIDFPLTNLDD